MDFSSIFFLFTFALLVSATTWELSSVSSSAGSLALTVERGSTSTSCNVTWATSPPTSWTKCSDTLLRVRIANYTSASNFALEVVQVALVTTTTPSTVDVTRASVSLDTSTTSSVPLATSAASWKPSNLQMEYMLTRDDGVNSGVTPCTAAYTFYIVNPNVATLGPITLGRGTETSWETDCSSNWNCGQTDPSLSSWVPCPAPAFSFTKTLPSNGNQDTDFTVFVKHQYPLLMTSAIRGSDQPDYSLTDAEEAGGLDVVLTTAGVAWSSSTNLSPVDSTVGVTEDCSSGCEYSGTGAAGNAAVVGVAIV